MSNEYMKSLSIDLEKLKRDTTLYHTASKLDPINFPPLNITTMGALVCGSDS